MHVYTSFIINFPKAFRQNLQLNQAKLQLNNTTCLLTQDSPGIKECRQVPCCFRIKMGWRKDSYQKVMQCTDRHKTCCSDA